MLGNFILKMKVHFKVPFHMREFLTKLLSNGPTLLLQFLMNHLIPILYFAWGRAHSLVTSTWSLENRIKLF